MAGRSDATGRTCSRCLLMLLALVLVLSSVPAGVAGNVANVSSPIPPPLQDFQLVSENEGWVLVAQRLYWTVDGGQTWQDVTPSGLDQSSIQAATFLDAQQGWVVGTHVEESGFVTYVLAQTADHGATWQVRTFALFESGDANSVAGALYLHLFDPQTGWLVVKQAAGSNFSRGTLFRTTDGGNTWGRVTTPIGEPVYFATSKDGWTAGGPAGDQLYHTQDGGQTWQPQKIESPAMCAQRRLVYRLPTFDNPWEGVLPVTIICGEEAQIEFYTTSDGGQSWNLAASAPVGSPDTVGDHVPLGVVDARTWLVSIPNSHRLLRLSAHGELTTMTSQAPQAVGIYDLQMASINTGWAQYMSGGCQPTTSRSGDQSPPPGAIPSCQLDIQLLRTDDGGWTWTMLPLPGPGLLASRIDLPVPEPAGNTSGSVWMSASGTEPFVGQGFDTCEIPTLGQLQGWKSSSPYSVVNLYIGGSCRYCSNPGLTADLVSQAAQQGWKFIPTWVGPQSACYGASCGTISNDPAAAYNQGVSEANAAISTAIGLGLALPDGSGTIIYYDLESYGGTDPTCRNAAKSFISGWTARLHEVGSESGIYGTGCSSAIGDFATIENVPDAAWPADWIYSSYNPGATVWGVSCLPDSLWPNHQRIRQYTGGHNETWGGVTLNIDCDVIDGVVANVGGTCCGCLPANCCSGGLTQADSPYSEFREGDSSSFNPAMVMPCTTSRTSETANIAEPATLPEEGEELDTMEEAVFWDTELSITITASVADPAEVSPEGADPIDSQVTVSIPAPRTPIESQRTPPASTNYRIPKSVFGSGGGPKISTHYVMNSTQGQSTDLSRRTSASYMLSPGYWSRWTPAAFEYRIHLPLVTKNQ